MPNKGRFVFPMTAKEWPKGLPPRRSWDAHERLKAVSSAIPERLFRIHAFSYWEFQRPMRTEMEREHE